MISTAHRSILKQLSHKHPQTITEVLDSSHHGAIRLAKLYDSCDWTAAIVDGKWGLFLVDDNRDTPFVIHFQTPVCGFRGPATNAAAEILALYCFGTKEEILESICFDGDTSRFHIVVIEGELLVTRLDTAA